MQLSPRIVAMLLATTLVLLIAPYARADEGDPDVGGSDDGSFTGVYGWGDEPRGGKSSGSSSPSKGDKAAQVGEDPGPITNCDRGPDGELLTPWDCPVEPVEVMDRATAEALARRIIVRLQLPKPTPQFGPDPSVNEWNMAAVGYPLWLWTEGPETVRSSVSAYGLTFTLTAHYRSTTFEMGDGKTVRCTKTTPHRSSVRPGTESPTCGYTYLNAAPDDGEYTVTATTHWDIDWSVAGFSGTLPGTHRADRDLPVGELQAIVIR